MKTYMKKLTVLLVSVLYLSLFNLSAAADEEFETAEAAVSNISVGWNLGNSLDCSGDWIKLYSQGKPADYETAWGNPVTTKAMITAIKDAGFNAVRVPVTWEAHIESDGNIDKAWLDRVQTVVDYVVSQDMYCIINVHHDAGSDGWLKATAKVFKNTSVKYESLWLNIAERFKDYDNKLMFEGFNEMLDKNNDWGKTSSEGYKAINDYNQLFVTTVRKTGGNNAIRNLVLQTYVANGTNEDNLKNFKLPSDTAKNHLIVEVHNYDPQSFAFPKAEWLESTDKWGTAEEKEYLDNVFETLSKYSKKWSAPIIVGEFGAEYKSNDSERAKYAEYFVKAAGKNGIKCFWWDTGGMALIDRENCKIIHKKVVEALVKSAGAYLGK